jgi:beta-lactamase regulating signal transducer with metallopeptidase domain
MELSFFSFLMAVLWSSIFSCVLALLQRNLHFIRQFGITAIFLIYLGCILRFLFPVEFSFTKVIQDSVVYAAFYRFLCLNTYSLGSFTFHLLSVLVLIGVLGTFIQTMCLVRNYRQFHRLAGFSLNMEEERKEQLARVLAMLDKRGAVNRKIKITYSSLSHVPCGIGLFKRRILLPDCDYTDLELYYILFHEFTHFANRDLFVKMAVALFCNLFWWNPAVYLLRRNLDEVLEIKCDLCVTASMEKKEKADYLSVIISSLERAGEFHFPKKYLPNVSLVDARKKRLLKKRFTLTANPKASGNHLVNGLVRCMYLSLAIFTLLGSYSFIFYPQYHAPEDEIVTDDDALELTPDNSHLLLDSDGTYYLITDGKEPVSVSNSFANMLINDGFTLEEVYE